MAIVISIATTKKTMQDKIHKNVINISRWNPKTCSSNAEEGKKREMVELEREETNRMTWLI